MAQARSAHVRKVARHAISTLVAVFFALTVAAHGFGERGDNHQSSLAGVTFTSAAVETHTSPADALCSHVHSEHHQMAPCLIQSGDLQRREARIAYPSFDAHAASREAAPPHGPPKA